jgi:hypothetical protein
MKYILRDNQIFVFHVPATTLSILSLMGRCKDCSDTLAFPEIRQPNKLNNLGRISCAAIHQFSNNYVLNVSAR